MILCFTKNSQIPTDTQHIEHLRPFMRVQEEEPPSPQQGCKPTATWLTPFSYILRLLSLAEPPPISGLSCRLGRCAVVPAAQAMSWEGRRSSRRMIPYLCS